MTIREKLIHILKVPIYPHPDADPAEVVADYLLDNGVTVQKWIPVTERLPHELLTVIIAVPNEKRTDVMPAYLANGWWKASNDWCYEKNEVSHWMPLPKPPCDEKG